MRSDCRGRLAVFGLVLLTTALVAPRMTRAAGVSSETIAAIDKIVRDDIDKKKVAAYSVAIVKDGNLALARGYGWADLENDVPASAETVYRLGSITKQFTALAIMQLVEQNKLSLDDELTKFLPDYPSAGHKVTVRHLLNHTSGIPSYTNQKEFVPQSRRDLSHDELLAIFKDKPFDFEPGAKWRYNNSGYYLLGMIIEKVSGEKYDRYLADHIFQPLGMTATRYGHMRPLIRHRAMGYRSMLGELVNDDPMSMNQPGAAGALVSNVLDLVKWHQALEEGALLSAASYEAMYQPTKLSDGATRPYGFGWGVDELAGHKKISHGGGINGFSTMIARYPEDRLCVIVLANTAGANTSGLETRISKLLLGIKEVEVVDLPIGAELLDRLKGEYQLEDDKIEIVATDGQLFVKPGRGGQDRLKYQGNLTFVPEKRADRSLTFTPAEGRATGFDLNGQGPKVSAKRRE
jgi:D-alanyl-D-alanine carboxypeptidase